MQTMTLFAIFKLRELLCSLCNPVALNTQVTSCLQKLVTPKTLDPLFRTAGSIPDPVSNSLLIVVTNLRQKLCILNRQHACILKKLRIICIIYPLYKLLVI